MDSADALLRASRRFDATAAKPLLALTQREPWWDTVDALATVIGTVVRRQWDEDPGVRTAMDAALVHPSL